jgi:hypothetical protein
MDSVHLTESSRTLDGLRDMMQAADDAAELAQHWVDVSTALLIIEVAKRAEDRPEWFLRGKWATIQSMQDATERELRKLFAADGVLVDGQETFQRKTPIPPGTGD